MEENTQPVEAVEQEAPASAPESTPSFTFVTEEEVLSAQQPQEQQPIEEAVPEVQQEITEEPTGVQPEAQPEYAQEDLDTAVFEFLSERLGRNIDSLDDLQMQQQEQRELDERISVIADFVEKTGRDPQDWFRYQSLNPSEMDDITAIKVDMASKYPNLSVNEINVLIKNQYKFDAEKHGEEQVSSNEGHY